MRFKWVEQGNSGRIWRGWAYYSRELHTMTAVVISYDNREFSIISQERGHILVEMVRPNYGELTAFTPLDDLDPQAAMVQHLSDLMYADLMGELPA